MTNKPKISFDEVFKIWLDAEIKKIDGRDLLAFVKTKGWDSVAAWRMNTALALEMDKKEWEVEDIPSPGEFLPKVIIGPFQGWLRLIDKKLETSFEEAMEIPEFFEWCQNHDRIIPIAEHFPLPTTIILYRKPDGNLIHIEGGHRICAIAYANKIGKPIDFSKGKVTAAIADIKEEDIKKMLAFLEKGTNKKTA
jgi:hypothetical protein